MNDDIGNGQLSSRAVRLAQRVVELVGTLVEESDNGRLAHRLLTSCVDLLGVDAVAVLLSDPDGAVAGSSDQVARMVDSAKDGTLEAWPDEVLQRHGFSALHTIPLRHRTHTVGSLYLFLADRPPLVRSYLDIAEALADAAAVAVVHRRRLAAAAVRVQQLQGALDSRIAVERATGVLSEYAGIGMGAAFDALRQHARSHRLKLSVVAELVVTRRLMPGEIVSRQRP